MTERTISVRLRAIIGPYKKAMQEATAATEQFGTKLSVVEQLGGKMQAVGGQMTRNLTLPLVAAMGLAVKGASDLQQAIGGTEAVFGEASASIDEYAEKAGRAAGLSERQFREATTSIGGQLKRMTGDVDLAAEQSIHLTQVAADLAATYGGTTAEAVQALGSAFRGEADPAERFNLNLKMGAVNAKAVEMGLARTTDTVSENARAQATLALITEQSADAQGQFAREAGSAAGSMQIARAEMENAAAEIGTALLPMVADLAGGVADLAGWFANLPEPVRNGVVGLTGMLAVMGPMMSMGGKVLENWQQLSKAASYLSDNIGGITKTAGAFAVMGIAVERTLDAWSDGMQQARSDADDMADVFMRPMRGAVDSVDELHERIMAVGSEIQARLRAGDEALNPFLKDRHYEMADALQAELDAMLASESAASQLQAELGLGADEALRMATNQEVMGAALDPATGELDTQAAAAANAAEEQAALEDAIKRVTNALRAQSDPFFAVTDAMAQNEDAQRKVEEAHWAVTAASDELAAAIAAEGEESWAARDAAYRLEQAQRNLVQANRDAGRTAWDVVAATTELKMRVDEGNVSIDEATARLGEWVAQGLLTTEQAEQLKLEMFYATLQAQELGRQNPTPVASLDASLFWSEWNRVQAALGQDKQYMPQIGPDGRFQSLSLAGQMQGASVGGLVTGPRGYGDIVPTLLEPGEVVLPVSVANAIRSGNATASTAARATQVTLSSEALAALASSRGGGAQVALNVTSQGAVNAQEIASTLSWMLARRL